MHPEDGSDTFLRSVGNRLQEHRVSHTHNLNSTAVNSSLVQIQIIIFETFPGYSLGRERGKSQLKLRKALIHSPTSSFISIVFVSFRLQKSSFHILLCPSVTFHFVIYSSTPFVHLTTRSNCMVFLSVCFRRKQFPPNTSSH
jgi:hypothetical protein